MRRLATAAAPPPGVARLAAEGEARGRLEALARRRGPEEALHHLIEEGLAERDAAQAACVASLQRAWSSLHTFAEDHSSWLSRHTAWLAALRAALRERRAEEKRAAEAKGRQKREAEEGRRQTRRARLEELGVGRPERPRLGTQGLYVWGDVGRGKSLLMDIFSVSFEGTPRASRQHYHDFMRAVHERLHAHRRRGHAREAVRLAAEELAEGSPSVLCLDEFQVTNIADAVVLRTFFEALFAHDVFVVMTSNRPPEDLYKDGLNHMIYMPPFLQLLREKVPSHHLDAPRDYREAKAQAEASAPQGRGAGDFLVAPASGAELHEAFASVAGCSPSAADRAELAVAWGRRVPCGAVRAGVAMFGFEELCGKPLGADDYMALVQRNSVHTVALAGVPRFTIEQHNEARRFMNLVDCLYENQCRLLCAAAAEPDALLEEVAMLSCVPVAPDKAMGLAGSERSLRRHGDVTFEAMGLAGSERSLRRHGDVTFEVSASSPCRPDTFATAEADAEAGTGGEIEAAIRAAKQHATGRLAADPTEQDGVAGVMSAALVSLQESGFAARRCASRLREMGTEEWRRGHRARWGV